MASISIVKPHTLGRQAARDLADRLAKNLQKRFDLAYGWEGDAVMFSRPGVSGRMQVDESRITLDVKLGLLLAPLKPMIEREINAYFERLGDRA